MSSTNTKAYDATAPRKVAFLGLGVMGFPMAGHLALAGHDVVVYNRSAAKAQAWTGEFKGGSAATPRQAAAGRDFSRRFMPLACGFFRWTALGRWANLCRLRTSCGRRARFR